MELSSKDRAILSELERDFPLLRKFGYTVTSPRNNKYNCIAWSLHDDAKWWWPKPPWYWPTSVPRIATVSAFTMAYALQGYAICDSREREDGFEKVALYIGSDGLVTHAARQLQDGSWTSKLGAEFDISHSLEAIECQTYGTISTILRRALS